MSIRIGHRQADLLHTLRSAPDHAVTGRAALSRKVGPHQSLLYGWQVIERAIRRGWVETYPSPTHPTRQVVALTPAGLAVAEGL